MTAVRLYQAGVASSALIAELQARCFAADIAVEEIWQPAGIAQLLASPTVAALIANSGDEPTAFLLARFVADEAEILSLGVLPARRRQGLARRLLQEMRTLCQRRGIVKLHLEVAADNLAALALYEGENFQRVGRREGYYQRPNGSRIAAVLLMLGLQADSASS